MTRADLKQHARNSLSGHWGVAIGVLLLSGIIDGLCSSLISIELVSNETIESIFAPAGAVIGSAETIAADASVATSGISPYPLELLISFTLSVGLCGVYLKLVRGETPRWTNLFDGFRLCLLHAVLAGLLLTVISDVAFLLLVIPAIIVSLGFSQTKYILRDQPDLTCIEAMKASWSLMQGRKMELFVLGLSFIGWDLLCILIIPSLYVLPYQNATYAAYYDSITGRLSKEGTTVYNTTDDEA